MTDAKHTPGPWTATEYDDRLMINGVRGFVCTMDQPTGPEQQANARLIAAAPDLLEACRYIVDAVDTGDEMVAVSLARKAIAKAESRLNSFTKG